MPTKLITSLKRHATELPNQLRKDETLQRRMTMLEGIAGGEKAIEEGRVVTHEQAKRRMARWLK